MATRERSLLAVPLVLCACVRWGIPDDEGFDDDYYEPTTYDYDYDSTTSTTADPDDSTGDETTGPEPTRRPTQWPEQWLFGTESRLVVWGRSGIPTVNLELLANALHFLAGVAPGERPLAILWIGDCDPRTDPDGCQLGDVQPFFDLVDGLGTIEFAVPTAIEPAAHDVVIADFCGPVDGEWLAASLAAGEGVLALGDRFCATDSGSSAKVANETLAHFGVRFGSEVLHDPRFAVPPEAQSGLLEGVPTLDAQDVSLQQTLDPVVVVVEAADGVLLSQRGEP